MALAPLNNMNLLQKIGLVLQNTADPSYLGKYQEQLAQQEERDLLLQDRQRKLQRESALANLAKDPSFASLPLEQKFSALSAISPDFLDEALSFEAGQQMTPYQRETLSMSREEFALKKKAAEAELARQTALQNLFSGGLGIDEIELNGPGTLNTPDPGPLPPGGMKGNVNALALARMAAAIDPESYMDDYLAELNRKPPAPTFIPGMDGYVYDGGQAVKIAGLPDKEQATQDSSINKANIVISKVDEALGQVKKPGTSGVQGQLSQFVGGTPAFNLSKTIDTIKAVLSFEELQKMREASKTGGALGSIAVRELELLGSTIANLDIGQSDEQLINNLGKVKEHYQNWLDAVNGYTKVDPEQSLRKMSTSSNVWSIREVR